MEQKYIEIRFFPYRPVLVAMYKLGTLHNKHDDSLQPMIITSGCPNIALLLLMVWKLLQSKC